MSKITSIGGQALMEGILMVGPQKTVAAFCDTDGNISSEEIKVPFLREKFPFLKTPFIRGIFNFIDTMRLGMKAMEKATDKATQDIEEPESKFEKWLDKKLGNKATAIIMAIATVFSLAISIVLFMFLPIISFNGVEHLFGEAITPFRSLFEGIMRFIIFILYIALISLIPDIKRVFQYHGAEHKTIFCYENSLPLTVENVKIQKRFHPRCGTSFMIIMIILGIIVGMFIPFTNPFLRTAVKILTIPIVVSIGYEIIKLCGKYNNWFTRIIAVPGLWVQRITTKEPDEKMIATAIVAMEAVIPENGEDLLK